MQTEFTRRFLPIGTILKSKDGTQVEVIQGKGFDCDCCYFANKPECADYYCDSSSCRDGESVYFKEVPV